MEDLIPVQSGLVIDSFQLYNKRPVFVVLQKFLGSDIKDIAEDFNEEDGKNYVKKIHKSKKN